MSDELRTVVVQAIKDAEALHLRLKGALAILDGEVTVDLGRQGTWTKGEVAALWEKSNHLPGVRSLFDITASRDGERVTFTELLAHSGLDGKQQGNEHARLSRVAADLFGAKRWPIENWQGASGEMIYRMRTEIAIWWREISG
ncbi:hypothetical protein [Actinokineospora globicatena]|uniref:hypothetical protein n=1 Tax=Actinokineospora globicatena TaxID=103729 RepID=UPI0020A27521|nr:hypothetical protein [Actinokineospora globicatena]MCP2304414.1 hypothetical protein [Actinokineospora globicatena]GLW78221.1 hypothetical protein Aglo01_27030 [Actinokineospora globicatena]